MTIEMLTKVQYRQQPVLFRTGLNIFSLKSLESSLGDLDVGDQGVQLVHGVFILVPQTSKTDSHPEWNSSHSLRPDCLVQSGVDTDILGTHLLLSKLLDLLDCSGSAIFESDTVESLVEVDGVLASDDLAHGSSSLLSLGRHLLVSCRSESSNISLV